MPTTQEKLDAKDLNYDKLVELRSKHPDIIIADMYGVDREIIEKLRHKHNIKQYNTHIHALNLQLKRQGKPHYSEEKLKNLLKTNPKELSDYMLDAPSEDKPNEKKDISELTYDKLVELCIDQNTPDFLIAEAYGVKKSAITCLRNKHGIKMYNFPVHKVNLQRKSAGKVTIGEAANAITDYAFRTGFLEELHAGAHSSFLENDELSRLTDEEMKRLMIESSAKVAELLQTGRAQKNYQTFIKGWEKNIFERLRETIMCNRAPILNFKSKYTGVMTMGEEANAITAYAFRNGFIEDLHAGKDSPLRENNKLSRITDKEMKKLMVEAAEKVAALLMLKESSPEEYKIFAKGYAATYCHSWKNHLPHLSAREKTYHTGVQSPCFLF
jgi:hypothetical protein